MPLQKIGFMVAACVSLYLAVHFLLAPAIDATVGALFLGVFAR